jgi:hypothetical protein
LRLKRKIHGATVNVTQSSLKRHIDPFRSRTSNWAFDLFTVRTVIFSPRVGQPRLRQFWPGVIPVRYPSAISGKAKVKIQTILVNQILGFDRDVELEPTNTFHIGFWFNDPHNASLHGFDPNHPTPFNGEASGWACCNDSVPDATTTLGPSSA